MFNVKTFCNFDTDVQKIFASYLILHETFSDSYGFHLMEEFNPFYPHLELYDKQYFCYCDSFQLTKAKRNCEPI